MGAMCYTVKVLSLRKVTGTGGIDALYKVEGK